MVSASALPYSGGVETHIRHLMTSLQAHHDQAGLWIALKAPPKNLKAKSSSHTPPVIWLPFRAYYKRACVHPLGWIQRGWLLLLLLWHRPRVIHFHDAGVCYPMLPWLKAFGLLKRTFLTYHGWEGKYPVEPWSITARQACEREVSGTLAVGSFIDHWYGTQSSTITYGGVDTTKFQAIEAMPDRTPGTALNIAYLGRLEADTGVQALLHALPGLKDHPIHLTFFGHGSLSQDMKALQKDLAPSALTLECREPVEDIRPVLASSHVIIASGYLTILEALCAKRPIIAFYDNPLREDYLRMHPAADAMWICQSPEDLHQALQEILTLDRASLEMRYKAAWQWAQGQDWQVLAAQYRALWGDT